MQLQIFAIKDRALNAFMQPFFMHTVNQAIRAFTDNINDKQSAASAHPEDYDLWHIGSFNDQTGAFNENIKLEDAATWPRQVALGRDLVRT